MDLVSELFKQRDNLTASINKLKENGVSYAGAERDYKVALNQCVLRLRDEKQAVTLIQLLVHGDKHVAELRFKRDVAKTIYENI